MRIKDRARPSVPPVAPGTYAAVCCYSIDLGEQLCKFKDRGETWNNQVQIGFELAGQTVEIDGKQEPRVLSRTFNVTRARNGALRKFLEAWKGVKFSDADFAEFDTNSLVGQAAFISVVLNETGDYANIESVMAVPAGYPVPAAVGKLFTFDMDPWNQQAFDALPDWAKEKIRKSAEYQEMYAPAQTVEIPTPAGMPLAAAVPAGFPAAAPAATAPATVPVTAPAAVYPAAPVMGGPAAPAATVPAAVQAGGYPATAPAAAPAVAYPVTPVSGGPVAVAPVSPAAGMERVIPF